MENRADAHLSQYCDMGRCMTNLETSFDGIAVIDSDRRILYTNNAHAEVYGYGSSHDLIGKPWHILCAEEEAQRFEEEIIPLAWEKGRWRGESVGRRQDGTTFQHEVSLAAMAGGKFFVVVRDLTEHKKITQELMALKKAVENMQIGITITDSQRKILYVNPSEAALHGYCPEELIGQDARILAPTASWKPVEPEQLKRRFKRESVNVRKDGSLFPVELMSDFVTGPDGQIYHIVTTCEEITERRKAEEIIRHKAYYDDLTNLPNRLLFNECLEQAIPEAQRSNKLIAVMLIDLDRFNMINNSLSHDTGDLLIYSVAQRLQCCVRSKDLVARLGGDEFLIMLPDLNTAQDAVIHANKVMKELAHVFILNGLELYLTASIGISLYPNHGETVSALLKNADASMYYVKAQGRNNYQLYTPEMNAHNLEHLTMENNLRKALMQKELLLNYQPQFDLRTGRIFSAEALMRWQHPELGMISPGEFIPIAEETGLIVPIGKWLLYNACEQIKSWRKEGFNLQRVAVNLSMRQFKLTNLLESIAKILERTGLDPSSLEVELTESIIMQDPETTVATLRELSAMGIYLSIDDFGTGYSSLNYLKYLPMNKLKIAPIFAAGIGKDANDEAICKAVITLAHSLNMKVIAEGVETQEQLEFLRAHDCDEVQGYLFSKPLAANELSALFAEDRWPQMPS
ncbi:MAG: bifunctional diguanylate cyclase/phosphodiesterase [Nitrospirae bacterium]|nr:MAG: bifunctional diguanylate cyclase/phosphodiesterase [Nitrospirota bacterium]